jgi:HSP20 family protein
MMRDFFRWDPFSEMAPSGAAQQYGFVPQFDVKETGDSYVFKADLPGVEEKDLQITLTGNRLSVSGQRAAEERREGETWYTYERVSGSFQRTFTLPEDIDGEHIRADIESGVLTLVLPKRPEAQPKKITVRAQGAGGTAQSGSEQGRGKAKA